MKKLEVRRIVKDDFSKIDLSKPLVKQFLQNIERWLEREYLTLPNCFAFTEDGEVVGGVCFADDTEDELEIMDFAILPGVENAQDLLTQATLLAQRKQTKAITYNLYDDSEQYAEITDIFMKSGFEIKYKKMQFRYEKNTVPNVKCNVVFKPVSDVGIDKFIEAVELVTIGTLDKSMADDAKNNGPKKAAIEYVEGMKGIHFNRQWWKLAYLNDELIGLILPQKFDDEYSAINYIGVVPAFRGKGYGLQLVAEGVKTLVEDGTKIILADIDVDNKPLEAQLLKAGFAYKMEEVVMVATVRALG